MIYISFVTSKNHSIRIQGEGHHLTGKSKEQGGAFCCDFFHLPFSPLPGFYDLIILMPKRSQPTKTDDGPPKVSPREILQTQPVVDSLSTYRKRRQFLYAIENLPRQLCRTL